MLNPQRRSQWGFRSHRVAYIIETDITTPNCSGKSIIARRNGHRYGRFDTVFFDNLQSSCEASRKFEYLQACGFEETLAGIPPGADRVALSLWWNDRRWRLSVQFGPLVLCVGGAIYAMVNHASLWIRRHEFWNLFVESKSSERSPRA